jgi:hypothetical protein
MTQLKTLHYPYRFPDQDLRVHVEELAKLDDRSINTVITLALRRYIEEPGIREARAR